MSAECADHFLSGIIYMIFVLFLLSHRAKAFLVDLVFSVAVHAVFYVLFFVI